MRSILFFLLSVCYVIVSGQKVKVHVIGLTGYKTLQFVKTDDTNKNYILGDDTDPTHVAVSGAGVIAQDDWEVGLVAKSASILEVPSQPEKVLELKDTCTGVDDCMELGTPAPYIIKAKDVDVQQKKMTCSGEGGVSEQFTLTHGAPDGNEIEVAGGVIDGKKIELSFKPTKCTIEAASITDLTKTTKVIALRDSCTGVDDCMELGRPAPYVIKAKEVGDQQTKMTCSGEGGVSEQFTLTHGAPDGNKIEVSGGVIAGKTIKLNFKPTKCTILEVAKLSAITLDESTSCAAGNEKCFQNIVGSSSTTAPTDSAFDNSFTLGLFTICVLLGNIL